MLAIKTKELVISKELKKKVNMICKVTCVNNYSFENGNIVNLRNTNIAYVKPYILKILIFEDSDYVFINSYKDKIRFTKKFKRPTFSIGLTDKL